MRTSYRTLIFAGAVLVTTACDRSATAPIKLDPKSANECVWIKSGDADSTQICDDR